MPGLQYPSRMWITPLPSEKDVCHWNGTQMPAMVSVHHSHMHIGMRKNG